MARVDRRRFETFFAHRQVRIDRLPSSVVRDLASHGVDQRSLERIAGDDHVISGAEFNALYEALATRDDGGRRVDRRVSEGLFDALAARAERRGPDEHRAVAPARAAGIGGRRAPRPQEGAVPDPRPAAPRPAARSDAARADAAPSPDAARADAAPAPDAARADAARASTAPGTAPAPETSEARASASRGWDLRSRRVGDADILTRSAIDEQTLQTAEALAALPPSAEGGHPPVRAFLDAMVARDERARLLDAGDRRGAAAITKPEGVPTRFWNASEALARRGISAGDTAHYLATGTLPDLVDEQGAVVTTGEDRMRALEEAAVRRGSWTAVNSFTVLVTMRRSSMAAERDAATRLVETMPIDDPRRAEIEQGVEQSRELDTQLRRSLGSIYRAATAAREQTGRSLLARAERYDAQAAEARAAGDTAAAEGLEARSQQTRDRGARVTLAEAEYRSSMRAYRAEAGSLYRLSASAQISTGETELRRMVADSGVLPEAPPATLGDDDGSGTVNGIPGAQRLLTEARTVDPNAASDDTQLALEGRRSGALAGFHREHLRRGDYFDRVDAATGQVSTRPAGLVAHREAYLGHRVDQANTATARLAVVGREAPGVERDLRIASLQSERRQVAEELSGALGQTMASDRSETEARARTEALDADLRAASGQASDARDAATAGDENFLRAQSAADAVFGDTFKTSGEVRRDGQSIGDARAIRDADRHRRTLADANERDVRRALETARDDQDLAVRQARRDRADGQLVLSATQRLQSTQIAALIPTDVRGAFDFASGVADTAARAQATALDRADRAPGTEDRARLSIAHQRVDLSRYWTRSAEGRVVAFGEAGRHGATARLDRAATLVEGADARRTALPAGEDRAALASGIVEARTELATANADYRPSVTRDQLRLAETTTDTDVADVTRARELYGRIGSAATFGLARMDSRFEAILDDGNYTAGAADALYGQAHRMFDVPGIPNTPNIREARSLLGRFDRALASVDRMFDAGEGQIRGGERYAAARTRALGHSEILAAQAQVSSVISGGAFLLTLGQFDMKEDMAEAGEEATGWRLGRIESEADQLVDGSNGMQRSWQAAQREGRSFEWLHAVRIFSDRSRSQTMPETYGAAFYTIDARVGGPQRDSMDWQRFNAVAIREGNVPVARALAGPVLAFERSADELGDSRIMAVTPEMADAIESQAESLRETCDGMMWLIGLNTALEAGLGLVLTGGIGSAGAVASGGNALNAARTAGSAVRAARSAQVAMRAMAALRTAGTVTVVGGGMMAANYGVGRLVGRNTGVARGFEALTNFIPIGAGQRAAGIGRNAQRVTGAADDVAAAGSRLASLRQAMSWSHVRSATSWSRALTPVALGSAQAFATTVATPWIAQRVGLERSDLGQAAIGLGLNVLFAGGMAAAVRPRTAATGLADHLVRSAGDDVSASARGRVRAEIEAFVRSTEGRMPTEAEITALKTRLYEDLGLNQRVPDLPERRAMVDGTIEAIRIERATQVGARQLDVSTSEGARTALSRSAEALFASRGGEAGGASRLQAYRDTAMMFSERLGAEAHAAFEAGDTSRGAALMEARQVVGERALAAELVEGTVRANRGESSMQTPQDRARVETILTEELSFARQTLDGTDRAGLGLRDGSTSYYDRLAQRLVDEGRMTPAEAETVVHAAREELLHQGVLRHLAAAQAEAGTRPLSQGEVQRIATDLAQRAGLPDARAYADSVVARRGELERAGFVRPAAEAPTLDSAAIARRASEAGEAHAGIRQFLENGPAAERLVGALGQEGFLRAFGDEGVVSFDANKLLEFSPEQQTALIDVARERPADVQALLHSLSTEHRSLVLSAVRDVGVEGAIRLARIAADSPQGLRYLASRDGGAARIVEGLRSDPTALAASARDMEARIFLRASDGTFLLRGAAPEAGPRPTRVEMEALARRAGVDPAVLRDPTAHPEQMTRLVDQMRSELGPEARAALDRELAGRRFVDEAHYEEARAVGVENPEHRYGRVDFQAWQRAEAIMMRAAERGEPLTVETLVEAHRAASEGLLPEGRRGTIRTQPRDSVFQGGDGPMGQQLVSAAELDALRTNPHLVVHDLGAEGSQHRVIVEYTAPAEVRARLDAALARIDERLAAGEDPVVVAADAQREVVSIHPFLDGNGRMSRLVMDYVLRREGLPPSVVRDPNLDTAVSPRAWQHEVRQGLRRPFRSTIEAWTRSRRGMAPTIRPHADPIGPRPPASDIYARRDTLGWTGDPTATPPRGAEHLGVIHRGLELMSPRSRQLIESYLARAEQGPPRLVAEREALAQRQTELYSGDSGRLLGRPAEGLSPAERAQRATLQREADSLMGRIADVDRSIDRSRREARGMAVQEMARVRAGLRRHVSEADARAVAEGMGIRPSALAHADAATLRGWVAEFVQLVPHEIGAGRIALLHDGPRANARRDGALNVGDEPSRGIVFHELGHFVEYANPALHRAARAWVLARSAAANGGTARTGGLRDLTGSDLYGPSERAFEDHFENPYVGRDYGSEQATEVVSVGMEYLTSPDRMLQLYQRDPEHFFFMLGVLEP